MRISCLSLAFLVACAAPEPADPTCGAKCDDPDQEGAAPTGVIAELLMAKCETEALAEDETRLMLRCQRLPFVQGGLPVADVRVGPSDGLSSIDPLIGLEMEIDVDMELFAEWSIDTEAAKSYVGLERFAAESFALRASEEEPGGLDVVAPFALWPIKIGTPTLGGDFVIENVLQGRAENDGESEAENDGDSEAENDGDSEAENELAGVITIEDGLAESFFVAVGDTTESLRIYKAASEASEQATGELLAAAPGHWIHTEEGFRPETFEDALESYCVPPSIMMHSKDVDRLRDELIPWLQENGYTTITYPQYADILDGRMPRPERPVILSIDDVPTDFIRFQFKEMAENLLESEMVASLAVNTTAPPDTANPNFIKNWDLIRDWQERGLSLESHGSEHLNLRANATSFLSGNQSSGERLRYLIEDSVNGLAQGTAARPTALITPFGIPDPTTPEEYEVVRSYLTRVGARFIVGIPGGRSIQPVRDEEGNMLFIAEPVFVGRVEIQTSVPAMAFEIEEWYRNSPECAAIIGDGEPQVPQD